MSNNCSLNNVPFLTSNKTNWNCINLCVFISKWLCKVCTHFRNVYFAFKRISLEGYKVFSCDAWSFLPFIIDVPIQSSLYIKGTVECDLICQAQKYGFKWNNKKSFDLPMKIDTLQNHCWCLFSKHEHARYQATYENSCTRSMN